MFVVWCKWKSISYIKIYNEISTTTTWWIRTSIQGRLNRSQARRKTKGQNQQNYKQLLQLTICLN